VANEPGRVRRALIRVISDDNVDLYLLVAAALVFTVLGITGVSDVRTTSAAVVALLAFLAFSQLRSRRLLEQIREAQRGGADALFAREFPAELLPQRGQARDILLVGLSMTRTVPGMRFDMVRILDTGGRIRVLVLDPADESLIETAERRSAQTSAPGTLRPRITAVLNDLTTLRTRVGGRLEVRVSSSIPSSGFNCVDTDNPRGFVCVQHYEYRPDGEPAPILTLKQSDGAWYHHFVAEAERMWEAGTEWPLSPADAAKRAPKPAFSDRFGSELEAAVDGSADLFVTGTARNSFVNGNFERLKKKLLSGTRIRFLLVDPDSPAVEIAADRYYAERSPDSVQQRVRHSLRLLTELKAETGGDLSVRVTSRSMQVTVVATEAALFAEYFPYQNPGTLKFVLRPGDAGHDRFLGEAEKLWDGATPYEM
jgi:hypothetical protein